MIVNQLAELENQFNAVERLMHYSQNIPVEKQRFNKNYFPKDSWPEKGEIEFKNYSMKYSEDKPEVLHKLNFKINECEKIGVCGRFLIFFLIFFKFIFF
jgi:ATP-binding cassette, subfamily C (CFTR/MRP), member 1